MKPSANKSLALPDHETERLAVAGWQMIRELLPSKMESDAALKVRIGFLKEIVAEVGNERFIAAIKQCVRTCMFRNEVTIARIRQEAGLSVAPAPSPAVEAWELVTRIVTHHLGRDVEGNAVLQANIKLDRGLAVLTAAITSVPNIPDAVARAVASMGGWSALAESYPAWWGQRLQQFEKLYRQ